MGRQLTLGLVRRELELLRGRIAAVETIQGTTLWNGAERRRDAAFSDDQTKRIKELFDERAEVHAGRAFFRLAIWTFGAAITGAASVLLAYIKLKG